MTKTYKAKPIVVPPNAIKRARDGSKGIDDALQSLMADAGMAANRDEFYIAMAVMGPYFDLEEASKQVCGIDEGTTLPLDEFTAIMTGIGLSYLMGTGEWTEEGYYYPSIMSVDDIGTFDKFRRVSGKIGDMDTTMRRFSALIDSISAIAYDDVYKTKRGAFGKMKYGEANLGMLFSALASMFMTIKKF